MNTETRTILRDRENPFISGLSRLSSVFRRTAALTVLAFIFVGSAYAQATFSGAYAVDEDAGSVLVTINFVSPVGDDLVVSYYTSNGTALDAEDYSETTGGFTILAGTAAGSRNFSIPIVNDGIGEDWITGAGTEIFNVNLDWNKGATNGSDTNVVTVTDDETIGELSINDASAAEGGSAVFTVTNTIPQDEAFMATFGCALGTAEAVDFDGASCTATAASFLVGQTSTSSVVEYDDDNSYEGDESYEITIDGSLDYTIGDGVGAGIIVDNDAFPVVSINDSSADEDAGTMAFVITADRPAEADYDIDLSYVDLTAVAGDDYSAAPVMVTMLATMTTTGVAVPIANDLLIEGVEIFAIRIVDGALYNLGDETGSGIINDNDGIDLAITASLDVTELDLDATSAAILTVTVTNNGAADATAHATVGFTSSGFDVATVTTVSDGSAPASCNALTDLSGTCVVDLTDLESGETVTLTISGIEGSGAPGTAGSITASVSTTETDSDLSNNAATDTAALVGLDFGDHGDGGDTALPLGAYHRLTNGMRLGASVDAETNGVITAGANGDDLAGVDDEDGVVTLTGSTLTESAVNYFGVTASHGGYLSAFYGDTGTALGALLDDMPVVPGMNWIGISLPAGTGTKHIRFRYCALENSCDTARGVAQNGEVEDHQYTLIAAAAPITLTIPVGTTEPTIVTAAANLVTVSDGNGDVMFVGPAAGTALTIDGNENPNTFVVDVAGFSADFQLTLDGLDGSDALELNDSGASTFTTITHVADNAYNGEIEIDALMDIFYDNFEPILDNLDANNRVFTFSANDDDIVLSDNGSLIDGLSFIDSGFAEAYTFSNPNLTLTVNAEDGDDTIDFQGVDESNAAAFAITFNGGMGRDHFNVVPFANTAAVSIASVNGNDPSVCQGDVLDVVTSGGAVIDASTLVAGAGSVVFTSAHPPLAYTGIEGFADHVADVQMVMTSPTSTSTNPGDNLTITLVVTNNGPDVASCVVVDDIFMGGSLGLKIGGGPTFSQGSFNDPEWEVGPLASGASATITYTVVVGPVFNGTATITALSPESDPDLSDNTVSLQIDPAFFFPIKAQATAAVWFDQGLGENLIVGTANGFAGLNSSVLCRVDTFGGIFPENLWRECGDGLPYPLYVNDMFVDTQGTLDNADDLMYLASWGSAGLYVSADGGESFTAVEPNLGTNTGWASIYAITQDVDGFLYISANHGFLYRSLNNGLSWQQIGSLPEVDADTPWSLTTHPTEQGRLYAGTFGRGVYTSDDYGFTWSFLGGQGVNQLLINADGGHAFDLELDPTGGYIFAATAGGVFRMELDADGDAVGIWQMLETEVTLDDGSVVTPEARSLSFDASGQLYVTTWGFGAFFSAAPTVTNVMAELALRGEEVTFVSVSPSGEQVAFGSVTSGVSVIAAPAASATDIEDETLEGELPTGYSLEQNYPNPFNPVTTIGFSLPETGSVRLSVFDVLGREVAVLVDGRLQGGQHNVQFDAQGLTTGTYIYRLQTDKGAYAKQLVLMK